MRRRGSEASWRKINTSMEHSEDCPASAKEPEEECALAHASISAAVRTVVKWMSTDLRCSARNRLPSRWTRPHPLTYTAPIRGDHGRQARPSSQRAAQTIPLEWVGARKINGQVRLRGRKRPAHARLNGGKVVPVTGRSGNSMSRSLACFSNGKLLAPWIEKVNTVGSSARMAAVPLP